MNGSLVYGKIFMRIGNIHLVATMALAAGLFPGALDAQTAASMSEFSGVWKMDSNRSESAAQDQPVREVVVAITQTGSVLRIETSRDGKKETAIYPVGPRPSVSTDLSGTPRAYWDGAVLVDEGSIDIDGKTIGFREARTQVSDGSEMIVETTLKVEHGYELKGGQTIVSGKDIFVRKR
jgi:hypothetical protein